MYLRAFIVLSILLETALVPVFLKEQRYKKTNRSLAVKMLCASLFMIVAILSSFYNGSIGVITKLLLIALTLGWVGDLFLHLRGGMKTYLIGGIAFIAGHFVYAYTYIKYCLIVEDGWNFFVPWRIVTILALVTGTAIVLYIAREKVNKKYVVPILLYSTMLSTMVISSLSVLIISLNSQNTIFSILIFVGSALFGISDALIGVLDFGHVKSFPLKCVNIGTYFAGQTLIALSLAFLTI